jgi:NTP pyrophosphatase (non-canonical NTP hydrolase)
MTVFSWAKAAFGEEQATSLQQRGLRLLEEAVEAFQSVGGDISQAHKLVGYVFARPPGVLHQELGGVGVTVLALAAAAGLSADEEESREVSRILAKPLKHFTDRNQAKNDAGLCAVPQTVRRFDVSRHMDPGYSPPAPWTDWDGYAECWVCRKCGAAAGYQVHNPRCTEGGQVIDWRTIAPADASGIDLSVRTDITAPLNEMGERCPWPWDPQQLGGQPIGQYHCPYCGAMVMAGTEHLDYSDIDWTGAPGEDPGEPDDLANPGDVDLTPAK